LEVGGNRGVTLRNNGIKIRRIWFGRKSLIAVELGKGDKGGWKGTKMDEKGARPKAQGTRGGAELTGCKKKC
jgi:hypothetical protein